MSLHPARLVLLLATMMLAACERAPDVPAEAPAAQDPAPAVPAETEADPGIDATRVVDRAPVAGAAPGFDVKAFAGTFAAEGANLRLASDGTYALTLDAEGADPDLTTTGSWTVEAGDTELLLDPDSKDAPDRRYTITSNDALTAVEGGQVLRRDGA